MNGLESVCVFAGSSRRIGKGFLEEAGDLGRAMAEAGVTIVYGGGGVGSMGALADAALEAGGSVIGVIPEHMVGQEIAHESLTELHVVTSMHARKALMMELSDASVALPGGLGTLEELFEVWTWRQLAMTVRPLGILDRSGYYDGLVEWLSTATDAGFVRPGQADLCLVDVDPGSLLKRLDDAHQLAPPRGRD